MCGIAGWIERQDARSDPRILGRMTDALVHRGPDGAGTFFAETRNGRHRVALGHRRLAIIDLVAGGQPMRSPDGQLALVFNGEIYNFRDLRDELRGLGHRFATTSDTEVLLHAYQQWGTDCLTRFRGMFAFAIWDAVWQRLFLARDRFGQKPLFFWHDNDRLVFASEIKALLAHPAIAARPDHQSVLDYLQYRYVPGPYTGFENILKLDPGGYALVQGGALTLRSYFTPPDATVRPGRDPGRNDAVAAFSARLDDSVRLRMVADVPFGAFLSGGLDSSAIVALMTRHADRPIDTFSVGFEEARYSELRHARQVADHFRTRHHELLIHADDIMRWLPEAIAAHDAPMAEPSDIAILALSRETARTVKMVLTGEGSDEILAGYPKHRFEPQARLWQAAIPRWLQQRLIDPLVERLPGRFYRVATMARSLGLRDPAERMPRWFGSLDRAARDRLAALDVPPRPVSHRPFAVRDGQTPLRRILHFDQTSWLPDNLLERGDRMMMAASIEGRMPFLDHELAALVATFPDHYRIRHGRQKWLLRQAMQGLLPPEILERRKVGFRLPIEVWLRTTLKDFVADHLLGPDSRTRDFYHRPALIAILEQHQAGRQNHEKLIWALLNLELFYRQYNLGGPRHGESPGRPAAT